MTMQKVEPVATDFKGVQTMFSCGRTTAEKIAKESGAEFRIGRKRMYSISKLNEYKDRMTDAS